MLTKDDVQKAQKYQNAEKTAVLKDQMAAAQKTDAQKTDAQNGEKIDSHNYSLDDVMLGKRVKIASKEKRLTQEELAGLCNCTPTHICNIENGKIGISLELLFKISIFLGKSMDYFVMDNPSVDPQVKINAEIAPKLARCNPQMLDIVNTILDKLIHYQDSFRRSAYESV